MTILEVCISCNSLLVSVIQQFSDVNCKADLIRPDFLERAAHDIAQLSVLSSTLREWEISPETLTPAQASGRDQIARCAKDLIALVYDCMSGQYARHNIEMVDLVLRPGLDINEFFAFIDKYIKAASVLSMGTAVSVEQKNFLKYAFDFNLDHVSSPCPQVLRDKRDTLIKTAISWSESPPEAEMLWGEVTTTAEESTCDESNAPESVDIYDAFVHMLNEDPSCLENDKQPNTASVAPPQYIQKLVGAEEENDFLPVDMSAERPLEEEEFIGEEELTDEDRIAGNGSILSDLPQQKAAIQDSENASEPLETTEKARSKPPKAAVGTRAEKYVDKFTLKLDDFAPETLQKDYVKLVHQCIEELQQGNFQERGNCSDISLMCWELLFQGEFMIAKEMAATFQNWCPCVNATVIALAGSGLWQPVTDKRTKTQFLLHQPLIQLVQLPEYEQTIAVLSAIPISHCSSEVKLDHEMASCLPECFQQWIGDLTERRSKLPYLNCGVIEQGRVYLTRLRKLRSIVEEARKWFQIISAPKLSYEVANKALIALCGQDSLIGILQGIITAVPLEVQAYGTADAEMGRLYNRARDYIPERKNAGKAVDDRFLNSVIEAGQKKSGYTTPIVGSSRNKMLQSLDKYLTAVNEWLELVKTPCNYDRYSSVSQFMNESVQAYLENRPQLLQYTQALSQKSILKPVYNQLLSVMDYLCGENEALPVGCKTYSWHMYRLCAVPTLDIQKNELGYYSYICNDPLERLRFLYQVMQCGEKPVAVCIDEFVQADAFSGCDLLFDLLPPEETDKIRRWFEAKKASRLKQLAKDTAQIRRQLYQISVFAGWIGTDYLSALSNLTRIEQLLKNPGDLSLLCRLVPQFQENAEVLIKRFCDILRKQVSSQWSENARDGWYEKLNAMIDAGQYTTVIEWTMHSDIAGISAQREDFFCERYFDASIYNQKERNLLDQSMQLKTLVERLQNTVRKTYSWGGFNFNKVPGAIGNDRARLIGLWYKVKGVLQNLKHAHILEGGDVYDYLEDILGLLGWDKISLQNRKYCEDGSRRYIQFDMYFNMTYSRDKCPIPLFGSNSDGRIRMLCIYGNTFAPDNLYHLFETTNEKIPMIILFFGVMTRMRRLELYHLALEKQASFLVVDDIVLSSICERRDALLLRWMYTLTVPFSVQTMYTSSLGVVHPEMFYGRLTAKEQLGIHGAVCAVYGGRQLGKTALLKNIEYESHRPNVGHYVYYIKLPTAPVSAPERLLTAYILNTLKADIEILNRSHSGIEPLLNDIKSWLLKDQTRRLLLLLDEADQFLLSDSTLGFRITGCINNLMTTTNMRFKVVFAGLHNVYRMITSPNHPLAHHGKPISIGPLMADELQHAINLIRQPFEIMGYRFESLDLIIQILAETNYYPSLIQLFCMKLHEYLLSTEVLNSRSGILPVTIRLKDINAVLDDLALKESISDRFMWTLELDYRYKAIALSIALDAGSSVHSDSLNNIVDGYDLHWISSAVEQWSDLFGRMPSMDEIRGLCDELVQLGILRSVSGDSYTLRTVNILNMLGTPENILSKMIELEQKQYDYQAMFSAGLYRGLFRNRELLGKCYPLTHQQIHTLFDNGGVKLILGNDALGLDLVETCLKDLLASDINNPTVEDFYQQKEYMLRIYREKLPAFGELGSDLTVNLILPECLWEPDELQEYAQRLNRMEICPILIVLCDEKRSHQVMVETQVDFTHIPMVKLSTWDYEAIQFWLNESASEPLPMEEVLNIMDRLQGWPAAMYQFYRLLLGQEHERVIVKDILDLTVQALVDERALISMLPEADVEELLYPILRIYAIYQTDISCADMLKLLQDEEQFQGGLPYIEQVMAWMADQKFLDRKRAPAQENKDNLDRYYTMNPLILELWEKEFPQA